ncbi:RteC domain-containing protein [Mucilaginibacter paludis]|uniref:Tetracycline regulation of excision, RteC n=1 Tax=Mucilaginibacter paludis DSM 18603 TaxID=714943 RepID=H1YDV2_9SPHI|nr:RteC domain-containing protein [Mucilaginibacter paludis]EHQ24292.1 Tetracycline regulation of excision, RteC [Mucilaginibacter paludis DSM 18603]
MEFVIALYQQLDQQLVRIETESHDVLEWSKQSYYAVEAAMQKLKEYIIAHDFKDAAEEIQFFKELKPKFYSRLIYYLRLFEIEANKPDGSLRARKKYLKKQLAKIKRYSVENNTFYKYYRSGATHMDEAYFTRARFDLLIGLDITYFDCDRHFCTSHDLKVSVMMANEHLVPYLEKCLQKLCDQASNVQMNPAEDLKLHWAETKTAFVELMYSLQSTGAFYNAKTKAKADIKDIARFFEIALNMELGNYYRLYYDITLRKKEPAPFLDKMKQEFLRRLDDPN